MAQRELPQDTQDVLNGMLDGRYVEQREGYDKIMKLLRDHIIDETRVSEEYKRRLIAFLRKYKHEERKLIKRRNQKPVYGQQIYNYFIKCHKVVSFADKKFGKQGVEALVEAWTCHEFLSRTNASSRIQIRCSGQMKGKYPLIFLLQTGHISRHKDPVSDPIKEEMVSSLAPRTVYMDQLVQAYYTQLFLLIILKDDLLLQDKLFYANFDTGLPIYVQFVELYNMPMAEKTKKAHINWSLQYMNLTKSDAAVMRKYIKIDKIFFQAHPSGIEYFMKQVEVNIILTRSDQVINLEAIYNRNEPSTPPQSWEVNREETSMEIKPEEDIMEEGDVQMKKEVFPEDIKRED